MGQEMSGLQIPRRLFCIGEACSAEPGRLTLHAFRLWSMTDRVCVEATDGRILVRASVDGYEASALQEHLPEHALIARAVCPVLLVGGLKGDVWIEYDAASMEIRTAAWKMVVPYVSGTYPDTESVWRDAAKREAKGEARGFGLSFLPRVLRVMQRLTAAPKTAGFVWRDGGTDRPSFLKLKGDSITAEALIMPVRMEE